MLDPTEFLFEVMPSHHPVEGNYLGDVPNGVRVTHIPSGVSVECDEHPYRYRNRNQAMQILINELGLDED